MESFMTNLSQLSSATSKLLASVDHENKETDIGKPDTTKKSQSKDPETNNSSSRRHKNTILDIRPSVDSDMKCKNDIQWIFHRLFETIIETKVSFLVLTKSSYFFQGIT